MFLEGVVQTWFFGSAPSFFLLRYELDRFGHILDLLDHCTDLVFVGDAHQADYGEIDIHLHMAVTIVLVVIVDLDTLDSLCRFVTSIPLFK